jgi:hypothetical protein
VKAQSLPEGYNSIALWVRAEGSLPNPDMQYPELPRAADYLCAQNQCSLPVFTGDELLTQAQGLSK